MLIKIHTWTIFLQSNSVHNIMNSLAIELIPFINTNLNNTPDVHFGEHFGGKQEGNNQVKDEGNIHQVDADGKHLGSVETDGHQADKGAESEQAPNPGFIDPVDVRIVIQVLIRAKVR